MNLFEGTKIEFKKLHYYGALLYAFVISFEQKMATFSILIWFIGSLINYRQNGPNKNWYLTLLPFLFLLYTFSLLTSENQSFRFLESKLSLLVFPFLFFFQGYDDNQRKKILKYFVLGLFISSILCLLAALYNSFGLEHNTMVFNPNIEADKGFFESSIYGGNYFFGAHLSLFHQTVYFALYLCVCIAVLLFDRSIFCSKKRLVLITFFMLMVFLISNKAGFISLALILFMKIGSIKHSHSRAKKLAFFGIFFLGLAIFSFLNPRIKESILRVSRGEVTVDKNARYGFSTRLLNWDAALTLVKENPIFGYGIGDAQGQLNRVYEEKGYKIPLKETFNAHNLFLQLWIESGIAGVIFVLLIFAALLTKAMKDNEQKELFLAIFMIFLTNSLFESVFSRFSGISFFSFFFSFFFSKMVKVRDKA